MKEEKNKNIGESDIVETGITNIDDADTVDDTNIDDDSNVEDDSDVEDDS
ncbi:12497_t:CDS:2, partial [Racocetra fulgida]